MKKMIKFMVILLMLILNIIFLRGQTEQYNNNLTNIFFKKNDKTFMNSIDKHLKVNINNIEDKDGFMTIINKQNIETPLEGNYLYAYPPYPLPAKNHVNTLLYWDTTIDINNSEMSVYDLSGNKICGKDKITLYQQTEYCGIVSWNSAGVQAGIYVMQIKHGTKTLIIKMIIE